MEGLAQRSLILNYWFALKFLCIVGAVVYCLFSDNEERNQEGHKKKLTKTSSFGVYISLSKCHEIGRKIKGKITELKRYLK